MNSRTLTLSVALIAAPLLTLAQSTVPSSYPTGQSAPALRTAANKSAKTTKVVEPLKPFSRIAIGGGVSLMGVNLQAATNINRYLNLRATGNYFNYTINNIETNGFTISAKPNFATAGASLDIYPFPKHGFRLSPGVMFYNQNQVSATAVVASGSSFDLNSTKYYSAATNSTTGSTPITMSGNLGLNANRTAFTATTGWGNMISRNGGHWSFPVEIGATFTGAPTVGVTLGGWACTDAALTQCSSLTSTSSTISQEVTTNLNAQIAKWKKDLDPLKVYPILSFGVAYNFRIR